MTTHTIYKGHNSPFLVAITDINGAKYTASRMATITRAYIKYINATGGTPEYADSAEVEHSGVFDWTTYAETGYMMIDIGMLDFTAGRDVSVELVVYDTTWTNGRVVALLDLLITEDVEDTPAPISPATSYNLPPLTVEDDYQVLIADFYRPAIRVDVETLKTMTMPAMTPSLDGSQISFVIIGAGDVKLLRNGTQTMINETHEYITGTQKYSSIKLEWNNALNAWTVKESVGHWTGGPA